MDAEVDRFRVLSVCQQFCFGFISIHRHVTAETVFEKPRNFFVGDISRSYARCCYVGVYYSTYLLTYDTTYFYDNDTILPLATVAVRAPCRLWCRCRPPKHPSASIIIWVVSLCSYPTSTSSPSSSRCPGDDLAKSNSHVTMFPNLSRRLEFKYCLLSIGKPPTSHNFN